MKRYALASVFLIFLLPLPLLCLWLFLRQPPSPRQEDPRLVPMLPDWQRDQVLTYERECKQHADCAPPLKCFMHPMHGRRTCVDSRCLKDEHCPTDFVCRTLASGDDTVRVRRCVPLGVRREGEPCYPLPYDQQRGCIAGLICQQEWCGRPCELGVSNGCPQNFFCAEGPHGPSCLPTCQGRACPEGQACVEYGAQSSICAEIHGQNCRQSPCPEGSSCYDEAISHQANAVWMSCQGWCDAKAPCPDQQVCFNGRCRQGCSLDGPETCGPHRKCGRRHDEDPWCMPDL